MHTAEGLAEMDVIDATPQPGTGVRRRKVAYVPPKPGTPEWDAGRLKSVGASEVVELMLPTQSRSPFSLYLKKTGQTVRAPEDPRGPQAAGRYFERAIADWYRDTSNGAVAHLSPAWLEHDDQVPVLSATPDFDAFAAPFVRWESDRTHIVEVKLRSGVPQGWGEEGTDQIPLDILVQVHAQLTVTGQSFADVAAFLGGIGLRVYRVHADVDLSARIRQLVHDFWRNHIEPKVEPPLLGPGIDDYVKRKYLRATSEVIREATPEEEALLAHCAKVRAVFEIAEFEKDEAEAVVKNAIAEHKGLAGTGGRALWSNVTRGPTVAWEAVARNLAMLVPDGPAALERQVAAHTEPGGSYRTFRFTPPKEK